jgi:hypothetical protein
MMHPRVTRPDFALGAHEVARAREFGRTVLWNVRQTTVLAELQY